MVRIYDQFEGLLEQHTDTGVVGAHRILDGWMSGGDRIVSTQHRNGTGWLLEIIGSDGEPIDIYALVTDD